MGRAREPEREHSRWDLFVQKVTRLVREVNAERGEQFYTGRNVWAVIPDLKEAWDDAGEPASGKHFVETMHALDDRTDEARVRRLLLELMAEMISYARERSLKDRE